MKAFMLIAVAVVLAGCADTLTKKPGTVEIQAPAGKCWSGQIGDSTKDGCGSESYEIDETIIVAVVQKRTPGRWKMRVVLVIDGKTKDEAQSTAQQGIAQVSEG
jgi:hypothetical protein